MTEVRDKINRLCEICGQIDALKQEKDGLDAYFQRLAEVELRDTKRKTVSWTADGRKVVATLAKKVVLQYPQFIGRVLASLAQDIYKTEIKTSLTTAGQRLLGGIAGGEYVDQTVEEVLEQTAAPEHIPLLKKKIRGKNYETDVRNFMAITGCDEIAAAENAYLVAEAAVWQELKGILTANKTPKEQWPEMIENIKVGVIVEETPKIRVDAG